MVPVADRPGVVGVHRRDFALTLKPTDEEIARSECFTDVGEFATAYSEAWRQVKSA